MKWIIVLFFERFFQTDMENPTTAKLVYNNEPDQKPSTTLRTCILSSLAETWTYSRIKQQDVY